MCSVHVEEKTNTKKDYDIELLEKCCEIQDGNKLFKVDYVRINGGTPKYSIREYYKDKEGNYKPGRNGMTMSGTVLKGIIEAFSH
jgi:hypothetical protein